jgi:hypothetical protein
MNHWYLAFVVVVFSPPLLISCQFPSMRPAKLNQEMKSLRAEKYEKIFRAGDGNPVILDMNEHKSQIHPKVSLWNTSFFSLEN